MIYSKENTLEDRIVHLVADGKMTIKALHKTLQGSGSLSLRAVYKATNKLVEAGVLLKVGKQIMIDQEWARGVGEKLGSTSVPLLSNGERATYIFVSMEHLDTFWKTTVLPLEQANSAREIFFYNPHNFWAYLPARKQSEDAYYGHFSDTEHHGFFTVGGDSRADAEFKRDYQHDHLQIDLRHIRMLRRTDHITIINPFIITVRLAKGVAEHIDRLYASGKGIKDIISEIIHICQKPGKIRFTLENNSLKAEKLRKVLSYNFYFKRSG